MYKLLRDKVRTLNQFKHYGSTVLPLLILWVFIHHFNIEVQFNLPLIFPLVIGSFIIHANTPLRFRKAIFILSCFIGLGLIMTFSEMMALVIIAFGMIGICNLSIALSIKKILLLIIGILFGLIKAGIISSWIPSNLLTVLASMFMFRMLLLLYEMKYQKGSVPFLTQVSYFMMLPNVIFPLFPVIDYKLFQRNYYNQTDTIIYQRGVRLMAKGVLHMFLYRVIYSYLLPSVDEVTTLTDLISFITFNYLLVIRLSGLFHFSVGVMCLFGYNLPDVFKNIFISENFSDLWRRLNIYWKDFIVKVFFNPMYFRLKKFGTKKAIFWSTIFSFIITLVLHSYQTFWLVGTFRLSIQDTIFWLFFGFMIALLTLSKPDLKKSTGSFYEGIKKMISISLTFTMMALMWSMWGSQSLENWLHVMNKGQNFTISEITIILLSVPVFILTGAIILHWSSRKRTSTINTHLSAYTTTPLIFFILLILGFNSWTLKNFWDDRIDGNDIHFLFHFTLNESDSQNEIAGYYDNILSSSDLMSPLVNNTVTRSKSFQVNLYQRKIVVKSNDAFKRKFTPSIEATIQDVNVSINRWGMYDKDYEKVPTKGTYRIAVLGGSIEMGWAIPNEQSLEKVIEKRLNEELTARETYQEFELLNFSVPSRSVLNHSYALRKKVVDFKPHMVVFFDHDETEWINIINSLQEYDYSKDLDGYVDSIYVQEVFRKKTATITALNQFEKHRTSLMKSIYMDIYDICSANIIVPVIVAMPEIRPAVYDREYMHPEIAQESGFTMIDLSNIFEPELVESYSMDRVGHPTPEANRLITNALYIELVKVIKSKNEGK